MALAHCDVAYVQKEEGPRMLQCECLDVVDDDPMISQSPCIYVLSREGSLGTIEGKNPNLER